MKYMTELTFIIWSLLYSAIVLGLLILSHSYWTIMFISFIVFIGFDLIRPALTNYYSNIAGNRQGFAGGLNSTFTSMGNFVGPLVAGALFDVNVEFPIYGNHSYVVRYRDYFVEKHCKQRDVENTQRSKDHRIAM